jgi:hypothetical protein
VRFLHYNGSGWEDDTVGINSVSGTVTGRVHSLSPIVPALVRGGTFGPQYFSLNPLGKIEFISSVSFADSTGSLAQAVKAGHSFSVSQSIKNFQQVTQQYAFIVLITDDHGYTAELSWKTGSLGPGSAQAVTNNWTPDKMGNYTVKTFVWDSVSGMPVALSTDNQMILTVTK